MTTPTRSAAALWTLALLALPGAAQGQDEPTPKSQLRALRKELRAAIDDWRAAEQKKVEDARAKGQPVPMMSMVPPTTKFVARGQALAAKFAGTDDAILFLGFVIESASIEAEAVQQAVATLAAEHAASAAIGDHLYMIQEQARSIGYAPTLALLDEVIEQNGHEAALVEAYIARSAVRLAGAKSDADRQAARADLQKVAAITEDEDARARAESILFQIDHLQVGCTAPEIEGVDTDGVAFKLSDYRGKVVMLDFWGFW